MMSNRNEVRDRFSPLSDRCWVSCRGGGSASSLLFLTLHDCQNNQKLRSFRIPYVRAEDFGSVFLVAVTTTARLCSQTFFGFNGGVEFLITPFEGESHGRFIPVIGE